MLHLLRGFGRVMVTLGLLILLFVAYELWGTGIWTARAQDKLEADFEEARASYQASTSTTSSTSTTTVPETTTTSTPGTTTTTTIALQDIGLPGYNEGDVIGHISIPKIGVEWEFVQDTTRTALRKGPGRYITNPLPGQIGNAAIAGHRTTYGAPFNRIDELDVGDEIVTTTIVGTYTYRVREKPFEVNPTDFFVVAPSDKAELTLTTCHPEGSARKRLVVKADMVIEKSDTPIAADEPEGGKHPQELAPSPDALEDPFEGDGKANGPAGGWGVLTLAVGLVWWWAFRRWRHPVTWVAGVIPFLMVLFGFYYYLERALPAGY